MDSMNRRRFIKFGGIGGIGLTGLSVISCGGSSNTKDDSTKPPTTTPPQPLNIERGVQFTPETLCLTPGTTTEEVNLNWYSDAISGVIFSMARFIDDANRVITAENNEVKSSASEGKSIHRITVKGLQPDTWYRYSVSNDGKNWSYEYSYRTPEADGFSFAVIGDPQLTRGSQDAASNKFSDDKTTAQGWKDTMAKVGAAGVDFIAGVGDQVDLTRDGDEQEYRHFFAPPELRSIPWAPAVGNHDRHYPFQYHYNLPNEQKFEKLQSEEYGNASNEQYAVVEAAGNYYYLYNKALFVVLNTSAYPTSANAAKPVIERFDKTLAAAKAANTGKYDWLFVQHHKSTASVADHIADLDIQYYVEAGFEELMTDHGVDFVLAGHDHVYARSYPLTGKKGGVPSVPDTTQGGDTINNPNGTIYVTVTTGSGLKYYDLYNQSGNLYVKNNGDYPYLADGEKGSAAYAGANINNSNNPGAAYPAVIDPALWSKETGLLPLSNTEHLQAKIPQYTIVDVVGNTVTFNTYNTYGDTVNSIDSFTVKK